MTIGSIVFVGLLAMAPNWSIVDLPYPESGAGGETAVPAEAQVTEAIVQYAKAKGSTSIGKADIAGVRIDGTRATARITLARHTETVYLECVQHEWRVVRTE
jgi:hypothetical protein